MSKAQRVPDYLGHILQAMRNRVSHGYEQLDLQIIWKTMQGDLPSLHRQIQVPLVPRPAVQQAVFKASFAGFP